MALQPSGRSTLQECLPQTPPGVCLLGGASHPLSSHPQGSTSQLFFFSLRGWKTFSRLSQLPQQSTAHRGFLVVVKMFVGRGEFKGSNWRIAQSTGNNYRAPLTYWGQGYILESFYLKRTWKTKVSPVESSQVGVEEVLNGNWPKFPSLRIFRSLVTK